MITLEPVSERTFSRVIRMKLPEEQNRFVAPNVVSLAQAWLYYDDTRPMAIVHGDEVVGFVMLDWDENERTLGVWRLMIDHAQQRRGYGRAALEAVIAMARGTGKFDLVHLDYVPGNDGAQALYASLGFAETGEIDDGEIVMALPLTDAPKLGYTVADDEDLEELTALIESERAAGAALPGTFCDPALLSAAVSEGRIRRLTLMGKAVGAALPDSFWLSRAHSGRSAEAEALLASVRG